MSGNPRLGIGTATRALACLCLGVVFGALGGVYSRPSEVSPTSSGAADLEPLDVLRDSGVYNKVAVRRDDKPDSDSYRDASPFDIAPPQLQPGQFEVLASRGFSRCAGRDFGTVDVDCTEAPCVAYAVLPVIDEAATDALLELSQCPDWATIGGSGLIMGTRQSRCGSIFYIAPTWQAVETPAIRRRMAFRTDEEVRRVDESACTGIFDGTDSDGYR